MLGRLASKHFDNACRDKASDYDCYMNGYGDENAKTYDSFGDGDEGNRRRIQNNYDKYKIDDLTNKRKLWAIDTIKHNKIRVKFFKLSPYVCY